MSQDAPDRAAAPAPSRKLSAWRRVARIVLWQLALVLFVIEVVLRFVPVPGFTRADLAPAFVDSEEARNLEPHPYLVGAPKPNWRSPEGRRKQASHNSHGLRGPEVTLEKPPGVRRIVCLGGSSTYGSGQSDDSRTWPARLQAILNQRRPDVPVEVINGGAVSWSSFESLINLATRMVEFQPDLVIVYHATNDAATALWPGVRYDNTHFRTVWPVVRPSPLEPILERSMTYLIWRRYFTDYLTERADLGFYGIKNYDPDYKDPYFGNDEAPLPRRGFQNFERNLKSIVAVARVHGARVLLMTQANLSSDDDEFNTGRTKHRAIGEMNAITTRLGGELGVPVLDASTVLEDEAAQQLAEKKEQNVFTSGVHLRNPGAALLARTIADFVLSEDLLP